MKDLRIGDMVLSDDQGTYTKYYSMGHYLQQASTVFLRVYTESQTKPLEISPDHMVFLEATPLPVPAHSIKVGDVLKTKDGLSKVTSILTISRKGLISPFTLSGTIVVDGIVSSIHTTISGFEGAADGWFYLADHKLIHSHILLHFIYAPHRFICGRLMDCNETLSENGYNPYAQYLKKIHIVAKEKQSVILTICFLAILITQAASFFVLEIVFQNSVALVSAVCIYVGWKLTFSKKSSK